MDSSRQLEEIPVYNSMSGLFILPAVCIRSSLNLWENEADSPVVPSIKGITLFERNMSMMVSTAFLSRLRSSFNGVTIGITTPLYFFRIGIFNKQLYKWQWHQLL